jgi:hypothetical protein
MDYKEVKPITNYITIRLRVLKEYFPPTTILFPILSPQEGLEEPYTPLGRVYVLVNLMSLV